jgi:hypothetical protein
MARAPSLLALAAVSATVVVGFGALLAHSAYHPSRIPLPADQGVPYAKASFTAADARRVFAAEGIRLRPRSRTAVITTLGNRHDVLEVDAFGDRQRVERSGFYDYTIAGRGASAHYAHFPRACRGGALDAERWRGNIRVIVSCAKAGSAAPRWLVRVDRALARL